MVHVAEMAPCYEPHPKLPHLADDGCVSAGIGHFQNTQFTVNNQIVHATLMAICDDPNRVSPFAEMPLKIPPTPPLHTGDGAADENSCLCSARQPEALHC